MAVIGGGSLSSGWKGLPVGAELLCRTAVADAVAVAASCWIPHSPSMVHGGAGAGPTTSDCPSMGCAGTGGGGGGSANAFPPPLAPAGAAWSGRG